MIPHSRPDLGDAEAAAVERVVRSGMVAQGREVAAFEAECAAALGRAHAVAVNSGTAALHLALLVLGVGPGARAGLPSYACAALMTAVHWQRAEPALGDVGADFNLDAATLPDGLDAVIVPHLFGLRARIPGGAAVIEDLAQRWGGPVEAPVAMTSFYATKLLCAGEGGMLFTEDEGMAAAARDLRDYDGRDTYRVRRAYKLTDLQAALGRVQLTRLPGFLARRAELGARYSAALGPLPLGLPSGAGHQYYRYVVTTPEAKALQAHLANDGIQAKRPVYRPAHHYLEGTDGAQFPLSERAHRENLSLPLYPALGDADAQRVIDSVKGFFGA